MVNTDSDVYLVCFTYRTVALGEDHDKVVLDLLLNELLSTGHVDGS